GPQTGKFTPNNALAAFNGENPNGTWTLTAIDNAGLDTGSIRAFSLLISATCPTSNISGTVTYCSNPGLPGLDGVTMTLTGTSGGSTTTAGGGNYSFSGLINGGNFTVTPSKAALLPGQPAASNINTTDVIATQR